MFRWGDMAPGLEGSCAGRRADVPPERIKGGTGIENRRWQWAHGRIITPLPAPKTLPCDLVLARTRSLPLRAPMADMSSSMRPGL